MFSEPVLGPMAWTTASLDNQKGWFFRLPGELLTALDRSLPKDPRPPTSLQADGLPCWHFRDCLRPALAALETGRGFVILEGIPGDRYSAGQMQARYWLIGQMLGRPTKQNIQGTLLYDVRDTGQSLSEGARFSVTSYESSLTALCAAVA